MQWSERFLWLLESGMDFSVRASSPSMVKMKRGGDSGGVECHRVGRPSNSNKGRGSAHPGSTMMAVPEPPRVEGKYITAFGLPSISTPYTELEVSGLILRPTGICESTVPYLTMRQTDLRVRRTYMLAPSSEPRTPDNPLGGLIQILSVWVP